MMSKVHCKFCLVHCIPEGRGGEKGGSTNFKRKHTEPLTQEIPSARYVHDIQIDEVYNLN